jgi:hypothetical protein
MKAAFLAALIALVMAVAIRWNSWVAGGSDSYCYVHQAERWSAAMLQVVRGQSPALQVPEPLALEAPWPDATRSFAPAGHVPSSTVAGAVVPICSAGLSIVMAPLLAAGGPRATFLLLPIFGGLLVLATYRVGSRFGWHVGMASAILAAASPIFLYQLVQPMSDVPAAALWMLAVAAATGTGRWHAALGGAASSGAILMRPNLLPLGIVVGLFLLCRPERTWRQRVRSAVAYAIGCIPGCVVVALVNNTFYGSPLASGYGSLSALFAFQHVASNLRRYLLWLWQTQTPLVAAAVLAPWLLPGGLVSLLIAMILVNLALYAPYIVFEDWSFLRFLLPTLPLISILVVAVCDAVLGRIHASPRRALVIAIALVWSVLAIREAEARSAFELQRLESRFERAGLAVGRRLPPQAIVITSWESGSVRFYGRRHTLVWDQLPADWLDRSLDYLRSRGYQPYLLLERWEEPLFRDRFAPSATAALDWPPAMEVSAQVRIYNPDDRARYLQGTAVPTEYVR